MVLSHKCSCGPSLTFLRNICVHSVLESNHYKSLGLSPSATHAEIKSAYYELSKKHHPDKNQGSEKSAKIFRDITAAYEILGNEKSRKQYDREQFFNKRQDQQPFSYKTSNKPDYSDEIERMFYEKTRKTSSKMYYGKTQYYDFDAWIKAHYGDQNKFSRSEFVVRPRRMYRHNENRAKNIASIKENIKLMLCIMTIISLMIAAKQLVFSKK